MNELPYKGYVIEALPEQLLTDSKWTVNISITKHTGSRVTEKQFSSSETFTNKSDAVQQCYNFGKEIIDGNHKSHSVSDL